jgi:ribosome-associated toxin RatA of RatAB toxin-antitoxin module
MKNIKFKETISIEAAAELVFDFTQDYTRRLIWDTFLKSAVLVEGAINAGKGVKAYCVAKNGLGMTTEYVTYNRPKVTAVKMIKGPYLFKSFLGSWLFQAIDVNKTEISFLYSFSLRFPFNLMSGLVKNNLQKNVRQRLLDLKNSIENNN